MIQWLRRRKFKMVKEKFDRSKPHVGISNLPDSFPKGRGISALIHTSNVRKAYDEKLLQQLISEFGETEGKLRFENLKQQEEKYYKELEKIDFSDETKSFKR